MRGISHLFINNMPVTLGAAYKACWEGSAAIRSRYEAKKNKFKRKETQVEIRALTLPGVKSFLSDEQE